MNDPASMTPAAGRFDKPATARQLLPPEAYTSQAWFDREQAELFGRAWSFAGMTADTPSAGDFRCVQIGRYPLFVLCGRDGTLRAFHNICRHRGNQLLEGNGGGGAVLTCPYHHWSYDFEGRLAGVPQKKTLFADLDMSEIRLFPAALGTFRGMVFVNPQAEPEESFDDWLGEIPDHAWPHDVDKLVETRPTRYEIACNWKVFAENAMDGYHLMHLHDQTLKGPAPDNQDWEAVGRHWVWLGPGDPESRLSSGLKPIDGIDHGAPGARVWLLFPNSGVQGTSVYWATFQIIPVGPEKTWVDVRSWLMPFDDDDDEASYKKMFPTPGHEADATGDMAFQTIRSVDVHAMDTGNFMLEDMWICERMQQAMRSPMYRVGPMAPNVESPLTYFQQNILDFVPLA